MSLTPLENIVLNYSQRGYRQPDKSEVPGNTPFVTGNLILDHFLHHMQVDHGISVKLKEGVIYHQIEHVEIVDELNALWFMLRWS